MGRIGTQELLILLAIALLIFGPKKLPALGQAIGKTIGGFKSSIKKAESGEDTLAMPMENKAEDQSDPVLQQTSQS